MKLHFSVREAIMLVDRPLEIALLADHPEAIPILRRWYDPETDGRYGPRTTGDTMADFASFSRRDGLPVGLVAYRGRELCAAAVLQIRSVPNDTHLSPWATAGVVSPKYRGQGIGAQLLLAMENVARKLHYSYIYCGSRKNDATLRRAGWSLVDRVAYGGEDLPIYRKAL